MSHARHGSLVPSFALALALASACDGPQASRAELGEVLRRRGPLVSVETTRAGARGAYASYHVRLRGASGIVATGRLLVPPAPGAHPAVLLNDGRELDSRVLDHLPADFGDVVVLALDYPAELPYTLDVSTVLLRSGQLREQLGRIPPIFSLGGAFLRRHPAVDSGRVAIVATSFAVPFAVIAAAADSGFRNVGLIYGAGELADVFAANLATRPRALRKPLAWVAMRPFADLAPERFAHLIAPRPLVMVNGIDDPQMPRDAILSLYAAAREPKEIVWLRTGHLMPGDSTLIRALVDTAFARLPVLAGSRRRP